MDTILCESHIWQTLYYVDGRIVTRCVTCRVKGHKVSYPSIDEFEGKDYKVFINFSEFEEEVKLIQNAMSKYHWCPDKYCWEKYNQLILQPEEQL